MIVVSDTGPLISLCVIKQLSLLKKMYHAFYFPEAVWQECPHYLGKLNYFEELDVLKPHLKQISKQHIIPLQQNSIKEKQKALLFGSI